MQNNLKKKKRKFTIFAVLTSVRESKYIQIFLLSNVQPIKAREREREKKVEFNCVFFD